MSMVDLDLNISLQLRISEGLDADLQSGHPQAFGDLERLITETLSSFFTVTRLEIQDAGPHNVVYSATTTHRKDRQI